MALTFSNLQTNHSGNQFIISGKVAFDSSYPTGGESFSAASIGLAYIDSIEVNSVDSGYLIDPSLTAGGTTCTLKAYTGGSATGTTGAGVAHTHSFTGSSPAALENYTITHDAAPGGNAIYVKNGNDGTPYLCCNMATTTTDKVLAFSNNKKLMIKHDAGAATGLQVYFNFNGAPDQQLLVNNTVYGVDVPVRLATGGTIGLKHDAGAAGNGVAFNFDDGADQRLEATFGDAQNHNLTSSGTYVWRMGAPSGTNANESTHTHSVSVASATEVVNGTNLSSLSAVEFVAYGKG